MRSCSTDGDIVSGFHLHQQLLFLCLLYGRDTQVVGGVLETKEEEEASIS